MNRKNTILLAVLINAGLLLILFISALTSQEELAIAPTHELSPPPALQSQDLSLPLFGEEMGLASSLLLAPVQVETLPQVFAAESAKLSEVPITHALPPVMREVPQEVVSSAHSLRPPTPMEPARVSGLQEVTVKKGDTLEKIAKAHHTTVDEIIRVNQLPSSFLRVGQPLKLPVEKPMAARTPVKTPAPEKSLEGRPDYYTVKVGDNPWMIAMKHHMKVEELLKLNGLNEEKARKLKPGDRLRIR